MLIAYVFPCFLISTLSASTPKPLLLCCSMYTSSNLYSGTKHLHDESMRRIVRERKEKGEMKGKGVKRREEREGKRERGRERERERGRERERE